MIKSRIQTGRASQSAHFQVYSFIPKILHSHPLLGLGLNNFSIYYQSVTGKTNWGPHSFYVVADRRDGPRSGRPSSRSSCLGLPPPPRGARRSAARSRAARDPLAARVRPLAWGCTAALAGTLASNAFYLTMQFYYFYAFWRSRSRSRRVFQGRGRQTRALATRVTS